MGINLISLKHHLRHESGGADEVDVTALSGELADDQKAKFFDRFREFIDWVSLDGYTTGGDTPTVAARGASIYLATGALLDNDAWAYSTDLYRDLCATGLVITVEWVIHDLSSITAVTHWMRLSATIEDPPEPNSIHFGFYILNGLVYSSAGNTNKAVSQQPTGITLSTGTQHTYLKAVYTVGTDIKFYVNDVLKVTETLVLPTLATDFYHLLQIRTTEAVAKNVSLCRTLLERTR